MPLIIIDYVHDDYSIKHGGLLKRFYKDELLFVEGQILETYEGWLGREKVRMVNAHTAGLLTSSRIYLPRDDLLKYGIVPRIWIVYSVSRVGDPWKERYYPVYPGRIVPYVPGRDLIMSRLEDLTLRFAGFQSRLAGIIYRSFMIFEELKPLKKKTERPRKKQKKRYRKK